MLGQHLESEAKNSHEIRFENLDSLPTGLGEVYAVNFKRAFSKGQVDPAWTVATPLELIAAAREPITVAMAAALLGWDDRQKGGVIETTALLFPERDGKFHVFHKTTVDWLTGEITEGSSIREQSAEFKVQRKDGHEKLAEGFIAWRRSSTPPEGGARLTMWRRTGCDMAFCTSVAPMDRARKVPSLPKLPTCMRPTSHYSVSVSIKAFSRAWLRTTSSCELWTVWTLKKNNRRDRDAPICGQVHGRAAA